MPPAAIEATQRVRLLARLDAVVQVDPVPATIPGFRKRDLGEPTVEHDAELEEFLMLAAAGWQ